MPVCNAAPLRRSAAVVALFFLVGGLHSGGATGTDSVADSTERPPNIIVIMVDDLGYRELGSYGQEKIRTPNLDQMAREGMRFTQFYSGSPVCAPSRATLLTGQHTGHTFVRSNYELGGFRDSEERGQLPLLPNTETIGTMLQDAGYSTGVIGKWGLGGPGSIGLPTRQGFDFFYGYLDQKQAHNYYPTHLWRSTETGEVVWDTLANDYFLPHQRLEEAPERPSAYDQYKGTDYAPDLMHEETLDFLRAHQDEPFFLYRAPIIPHVSLQVPDEELRAYNFEETPYLGQEGYLPHPRPRAAYAGMISRLDRYVGEVLELLKTLGLVENTLVLFTSDNGTTFNGGTEAGFFNSVGRLRGRKTSVYEGGIRVPMIAHWPGRVPSGTVSEQVGALWDVLPTVADLTGASPPTPIDGVSLAPALQEPGGEAVPGERPPLYWEYYGPCGGQQAVRKGRWKAVRVGAKEDETAPIELYNLEADPGESNNVAAEHPGIVRELWREMKETRTPSVIERWYIAETEGRPPVAETTPRHACFAWNAE